jgi:hypothetical protein
LGSNLVFRFAVGAIVAVVLYAITVAIWLAWHRKTFRKVGFGGAAVEADPDATAGELSARDREVAEFMDATTHAIDQLVVRVEALERRPNP